MTRTFEALRRDGATRAEALDLFDRLEPATVEGMLGTWRGSGFPTRHPMDGLLEAFAWYGKSFVDEETVDPLLFGDAARNVAVDPRFVPMWLTTKLAPRMRGVARAAFEIVKPLVTTKRPAARLRVVTYRGTASAAMIYDALPIIDVFRKAGDDTLLGLMDYRGFRDPFFFVLDRARTAGGI